MFRAIVTKTPISSSGDYGNDTCRSSSTSERWFDDVCASVPLRSRHRSRDSSRMRWTHVVVGLVLCGAISPALAKPRLSIAEARKVALARVPGRIVHEKLKKKKKGHDRYNFKIVPVTNAKPHFVEKVSVAGDPGKILKIKLVPEKTEDDDPSD
jgi:hypothetical protein